MFAKLKGFDFLTPNEQMNGKFVCKDVGINNTLTFQSGPDPRGYVALTDDSNEHLRLLNKNKLYLAPVGYVDGDTPIYRGDTVYTKNGTRHVVARRHPGEEAHIVEFCNSDVMLHISCLTAIKPKTKRSGWVNVYASDSRRDGCIDRQAGGLLYESAEAAEHNNPSRGRIATVQIEWEE